MIGIDDGCMGCDAKPEIGFIVQTMAGEEPIDRVTLCTQCASEVGGPFCFALCFDLTDRPDNESWQPF